MTLNQLLAVIVARWRFVLTFVLIGVLGAAILTRFHRATYREASEIVISANAPQVLDDPAAQADVALYLKTQIDILGSDRVIQVAVDKLKLTQRLDLIAGFQRSGSKETIEEYCVAFLKKGLTILPSKDSRLVRIIFEGPDPKLAADIANAVAAAFVDVDSDLVVSAAKRSAEDFNKHVTVLREELNKAQQRLDAYRQKNGLVSVDGRDDISYTRLNSLSTELAAAQIAQIQAEQNYASAASAVKLNRGAAAGNVIDSPVLKELEAEEGRVRTQLEALASRVGTHHPDYIEQTQRLASLEGQIDAERQNVVKGLASTARIARERLVALQAEIASQTKTLLTTRSGQDELNALTQEVDNAKRAYEMVLQRFSNAALNSKNEGSGVSVLTTATPSYDTAPMSFAASMLTGGFLGLVAGIIGAALMELADTRIRGPGDTQRWLGVPTLAEIPAFKASAWERGEGAAAFSRTRTVRMADQPAAAVPAGTATRLTGPDEGEPKQA